MSPGQLLHAMSSPWPGLRGSGSCLPHRGVPGPGRGTELLDPALGAAEWGWGRGAAVETPTLILVHPHWALLGPPQLWGALGLESHSAQVCSWIGRSLPTLQTPKPWGSAPAGFTSECQPGIPRVLVSAVPVWAAWWEPRVRGSRRQEPFFPCPSHPFQPPLCPQDAPCRLDLGQVLPCHLSPLYPTSASRIPRGCCSDPNATTPPAPAPPSPLLILPAPSPTSIPPSPPSFSRSSCPHNLPPVPIDCISPQAFPAPPGKGDPGRRGRGWDTAGHPKAITDPLAPLLLCSHRVHAHPHPTETAGHAEETQ